MVAVTEIWGRVLHNRQRQCPHPSFSEWGPLLSTPSSGWQREWEVDVPQSRWVLINAELEMEQL